VAEQLPVMRIYYNPSSRAYVNRLVNVSPPEARGSNAAWNGDE